MCRSALNLTRLLGPKPPSRRAADALSTHCDAHRGVVSVFPLGVFLRVNDQSTESDEVTSYL